MPNILEMPAAASWVKSAISDCSCEVYGSIVPAVIWTNANDPSGSLIVPLEPNELSLRINNEPYIVLHDHDPGKPKGQVLNSAVFQNDRGTIFVAAIIGLYAEGNVKKFSEFELGLPATFSSPDSLPCLPENAWIELALDPREVDSAWIASVSSDAPLHIKHVELSHNAAENTYELIHIGLSYLAIVWNPFVTTVATEAGKRTYNALHQWVHNFLGRLSERKNPIIDIASFQDGCQVSFLIRGKDTLQHYMAHDALSEAGVQAAQLISKLRERGKPPTRLIYEWDKKYNKWYPSYALLNDRSIIVDQATLIALEKLPTNLSLGIRKGENVEMIFDHENQSD